MSIICIVCDVKKEEAEFPFWKTTDYQNGGRENTCRLCKNVYANKRSKTEIGVISSGWRDDHQRNVARGIEMSYTTKEAKERWLEDPEFIRLYTNWVESEYMGTLRPVWYMKEAHMDYTWDSQVLMTLAERSIIYSEELRASRVSKDMHRRLVKHNPVTGDILATYSGLSAAEAAFIPRSIVVRSIESSDGVWAWKDVSLPTV